MRLTLCLLLTFMLSPPLSAAPAPWFHWYSKLDGKTACAQASPGSGWKQGDGPYRDAHCLKRSFVASAPQRAAKVSL
ncbi:hypothetical protein JCM19000A_06040 [Silvimonas sp. JCM 19000]